MLDFLLFEQLGARPYQLKTRYPDALIDLVHDAFHSYSGKFCVELRGIKALRENKNRQTALRGRGGFKHTGFQGAAYMLLLPSIHPVCFPSEIAHRLRLWLEPARLIPNLVSMLHIALAALASYRPAFKITFLKTLCNGWFTSRRRQIHDQGCVFHCSGEQDSLQHYISCPNLWPRVCAQRKIPPLVDWRDKLCLNPETFFQSLVTLHAILEAYQTQYHVRSQDLQSRFHDAIRRTNLLT